MLSQKWIEEALKEFFNKQEITSGDLKSIRYLKIGETFCNDFIIEVSKEEPPVPFSDPCGGDEWECCVLTNNQIEDYVNTNVKDNSIIELATTPFSYEHEEIELTSEDYDKAQEFSKTVFSKNYYEKIEDEKQFEKWYEETKNSVLDDIKFFPCLKVLRLQGGLFKDFSFLNSLNDLEVLEMVETKFEDVANFEKLKALKELCCWMD